MTNEKIKKALEMCISSDPCDDCPYHNDGRCSDTLKTDARECIIEQEKEIEKLKNENARLKEKLKQVLLAVDTVKEMNTMCAIDEQKKLAVQDFVVKLEEKCKCIWIYKCSFENIIPAINQVLEDMKDE